MAYFFCLILALFGACGCSSKSSGQSESPKQLTVEDVKMLSKNGLPDNTIINRIRDSHSVFHLTPAQIIDLENSGVSRYVIDYMIQTGEQQ